LKIPPYPQEVRVCCSTGVYQSDRLNEKKKTQTIEALTGFGHRGLTIWAFFGTIFLLFSAGTLCCCTSKISIDKEFAIYADGPKIQDL
jgi:hypothetical protein